MTDKRGAEWAAISKIVSQLPDEPLVDGEAIYRKMRAALNLDPPQSQPRRVGVAFQIQLSPLRIEMLLLRKLTPLHSSSDGLSTEGKQPALCIAQVRRVRPAGRVVSMFQSFFGRG